MYVYWQTILKDQWNIDAVLSPLDGEYDLNLLAKGDTVYVLKIMRPGCDADFIDMQCKALAHLQENNPNLPLPKIIKTSTGAYFTAVADEDGNERLMWLLEKIDGKLYANFAPHTESLIHELGATIGAMDKAFSDFTHPSLQRDFKWNLCQGNWIADKLNAITSSTRKSLIEDILTGFQQIKPKLDQLDKVAIHNDVNDYNILIAGSLSTPTHITGLIDLGDMCAAPRICDLAITAAYVVLAHPNPEKALVALVRGYHEVSPLAAEELDMLWPLLRLRLAVSVVNSTLMSVENPDDPYVIISQKPAWAFLEDDKVDAGLIRIRLRAACDLPVSDAAPRIMNWLESQRGQFAPLMGVDIANAPMGSLSIENSTTPENPFDMPLAEAAICGDEYYGDNDIWLGYYGEPRLVYTADAFRKGPWKGSDRRTVHLAVDAFAEAGTELHAPMAATVHFIANCTDHLDYGGVIILRHETPDGDPFFTLYGHQNPEVCDTLKIGQKIEKGEVFCRLGDITQSGGWAPHVHFQLAVTTEGMGNDWPGVGDPDEMYLWRKACPNPAMMLNLPDEKTLYKPTDKQDILDQRQSHFGKNLKLTYADPVMLVRGWKHHLFDEWGRPYLDAYNNVPHVGHAHPRIAAAAMDQLKRINSNSRYLHPSRTAFADKILSKMPDELSVCFFVNSGTEANELALRLARAHTGGKDMVTPDHGYHGNTTGAIDISAYKFNAKGGIGQPSWVQLVDVADGYRGRFRHEDPNCAENYASLVDDVVDEIEASGGQLAGFIAETFPSVGGQIIPPQGYLADVYKRIRAAGGVCIADEVQTGLGRLGEYYFGFEQQKVLPDIVVIGKPIGNGHPIGVLITTQEIADSFAEGPEYFSTFGGSNLSCRMGKEVLDIVDDEDLMTNAKVRGDQLMAGLRELQEKHTIIGDVRGIGLFIGLDLVTDRESRTPATEIADYVKNRMRDHRILMGTEGPADNILKIRPPLTIEAEDVEMILHVMDQTLTEAAILNG
jgi:4-aminobutyrate aminotransferase-like enzyme/Ser/Thr protein kinase RdoA (MazF antagonist)